MLDDDLWHRIAGQIGKDQSCKAMQEVGRRGQADTGLRGGLRENKRVGGGPV